MAAHRSSTALGPTNSSDKIASAQLHPSLIKTPSHAADARRWCKQPLTPRTMSSATIYARQGSFRSLATVHETVAELLASSCPVCNILATIHGTSEPESSGALYIARSGSRREG